MPWMGHAKLYNNNKEDTVHINHSFDKYFIDQKVLYNYEYNMCDIM